MKINANTLRQAGENARRLRLESWDYDTREDVAEQAGVTVAELTQFEKTGHGISPFKLEALADAFGLTLDELLTHHAGVPVDEKIPRLTARGISREMAQFIIFEMPDLDYSRESYQKRLDAFDALDDAFNLPVSFDRSTAESAYHAGKSGEALFTAGGFNRAFMDALYIVGQNIGFKL